MDNTRKHILAIDHTIGSEEAFKHATENLPPNDEFYLVHGRRESNNPEIIKKELTKHKELIQKFSNLCSQSKVIVCFG